MCNDFWISNIAPIIKCHLDGTRTLEEEIHFIFRGCLIRIPKGFSCDSSSIPRLFWRVCGAPTTGSNLLAGVIHDYLYSKKVFDRELCDLIFYEALKFLGKPKWIAWIMFKAVRIFGSSHY